MIYKRISEMMDGLELDMETIPMSDTDFINAEEIKAAVFQKIHDPEGGGQYEDQGF